MPTRLTDDMIEAAILGFEEKKRRIDAQVAELRTMLSGSPAPAAASAAPETDGRPRRKVSAAGRKAMALAQQKRWAAKRAGSEPAAASVAAKPKRKMSAAGRAAIAAAVRKRWAAKNAEAKK